MNRFVKLSLVVALTTVGGVWSQVGIAQQTHDAVAKARGAVGRTPVLRQPENRYLSGRVTPPLPLGIAQRPSNNLSRTFSYDPSQATARQFVTQRASAQPRHSGFHDAGAKVRGDFGN